MLRVEKINMHLWILVTGLMSTVFANGPGDRGSLPGKSFQNSKMALDAYSINTQHYKVRIKGKVEQSRLWSSALLYTSWKLLASSYWKGSPRVTLDYSRQLHLFMHTNRRKEICRCMQRYIFIHIGFIYSRTHKKYIFMVSISGCSF